MQWGVFWESWAASDLPQTSVCEKIMEAVGQRGRVSVVSQDSFYKDLTEDEQESAHAGEYNFDHPGGQHA